jgi:hypothetical protein
MKHEYTSNKTIAMVLLLIFLVTSLLFLLYDRLVERHQRLVQWEAEKSGAIVSSLFPAAFRDRLKANQATTQGNTKAQIADKGSKNSQVRSTTRSARLSHFSNCLEVNTAKSTGEIFFIQVSSRTADLLRDAGRGHWMLPRADLVEAKGKGHMHQFGCNVNRARFTVGSLPTLS